MYEINDRFKAIRKDKGMSQEEFGNALGIGRGWVTNIEHHKKEPEETKINLACEQFHINKTWLLTGEGEMYEQLGRKAQIAQVFADICMEDSFRSRLIATLAALDKDDWRILEQAAEVLKKKGI